MFVEMETGKGTHENDVLLMINKHCKDKGRDWIRVNYGVNFKLKEEKTYEGNVPMMTEK